MQKGCGKLRNPFAILRSMKKRSLLSTYSGLNDVV